MSRKRIKRASFFGAHENSVSATLDPEFDGQRDGEEDENCPLGDGSVERFAGEALDGDGNSRVYSGRAKRRLAAEDKSFRDIEPGGWEIPGWDTT